MEWIKQLLTNKWLYISIVGVSILAAGTIYSIDRWIMPAYTNYNEGITVPDVTKLSLQEAESLLEMYGLRHEILDRRAHSAYPADYIIDQAPAPRQIVKPNRKVYLTVNTEVRPTVAVPNLTEMSLRNAEIQLQNYGLTRGTINYESGRFRLTVLRQSIDPGESVEQGTVIDLVVSDGLGGDLVQVPDIEGLLLPEAIQRLRAAGLEVGTTRFQPSREVIPNTVLSFSPNRGQLREGEPIHLVISERFDVQEEQEAGAVVDEDEDIPEIEPGPEENE